MLPLTVGFLISGPVSGILSDRYGTRPLATGGMVAAALSFGLLELLPIDFSYVGFAALLLLNGPAMGPFAAPNRAGIMNSLPPDQRGEGAGMVSTFQNAGMVLSIGIYFSLVVICPTASLSRSLLVGLTSHGVPRSTVEHVAHLPPVSVLFAAFLGYNAVRSLLCPSGVLAKLHADASTILGGSFFPHLISAPFTSGLHLAFASRWRPALLRRPPPGCAPSTKMPSRLLWPRARRPDREGSSAAALGVCRLSGRRCATRWQRHRCCRHRGARPPGAGRRPRVLAPTCPRRARSARRRHLGCLRSRRKRRWSLPRRVPGSSLR